MLPLSIIDVSASVATRSGQQNSLQWRGHLSSDRLFWCSSERQRGGGWRRQYCTALLNLNSPPRLIARIDRCSDKLTDPPFSKFSFSFSFILQALQSRGVCGDARCTIRAYTCSGGAFCGAVAVAVTSCAVPSICSTIALLYKSIGSRQ